MKKATLTLLFIAVFFLLARIGEAFEDCSAIKGRIIQATRFDIQAYLFVGLAWIPAGYFEKAGYLKETETEEGKIICVFGQVSFLIEGIVLSETRDSKEKTEARYKVILASPQKLWMDVSPEEIKISREEKSKLITRVYPANGYEKSGLVPLLAYLKARANNNSHRTLFPFGEKVYEAKFFPFAAAGEKISYKAVISNFDGSGAIDKKEEEIKSIKITVKNGEIISAEAVFDRLKVVLTKVSE